MKVIFSAGFKSIPSGAELLIRDNRACYCTNCGESISLNQREIDMLVTLGIARLVEEVVVVPFAPNFSTREGQNIADAVQLDSFNYDQDYVFYDVKEKAYKTSKLLKTASHIGRVVSGFAIPAGSSAKKKYNRLTNLNVVYGLGLTKREISSISGHPVR